VVVRDVSGVLHDLRKQLVYLKEDIDQALAKLDEGLVSIGLVNKVRPRQQERAQLSFKPLIVN
jgi:hypothetical protein